MSTDKRGPTEYFCYECAVFHDVSEMQKYDCTICGGRKCFIHGGKETHTCEDCHTTNLCVDCLKFAKCCHSYDSKKNEFTFTGKTNYTGCKFAYK